MDAFAVAQYLKEKNKNAFDTLVKVPLKFRDKDYTQQSHRGFHAPAISLTKDDDFHDVRFSIATMAAMDCHPKVMEKFYKAYRKFAELLHNNKFTNNK